MMRIEDGVQRLKPAHVEVDGERIACFEGETVAAVMIASGLLRFRDDTRDEPRGLFCNMGSCGECFVRVGPRRQRACLTPVSDGLVIWTK